jgi:UDP:flavonoid glycosyltransferase YjiC (YdhE family)
MQPKEIQNKRILLSPLNWGMGHVARCIPLIDLFIKNGNTVFVAGNKIQLHIFKTYFPTLDFVEHSDYPFVFRRRGNFSLDLFRQFRKLKNRLNNELFEVDKLVDIHEIDIVFSDHRYGFRSEKVHSIMLTHQLNLPLQWFESWVQIIHNKHLRKFNEIWVPDSKDSSFAGNLSKNKEHFNVTYIGNLSRFSLYEKIPEKTIDKVIILSGPAIYAKVFLQEQLLTEFPEEQSVVIIASQEIVDLGQNSTVKIQASTDWKACDQLILKAKKIVARSGYSTLMDLVELKTPFQITPTPGQREQEYLFDLWYKKTL